jgi:hypothetical protein
MHTAGRASPCLPYSPPWRCLAGHAHSRRRTRLPRLRRQYPTLSHAPEPWRTDRFFLATSAYTRHFKYDPAHNDDQNLMLVEWNVTEQWLVGAAQFDNSFGQVTQYVYGGYRARPLPDLQAFYFKVSAGLIYGYKDEYAKKIPLNDAGVAPVIIPTLGYCLNRFCSELVFFGAAGVMLTFGVTIP